jgi:hypothetical protein
MPTHVDAEKGYRARSVSVKSQAGRAIIGEAGSKTNGTIRSPYELPG